MTLKERIYKFADKQNRKEEELAAGRRSLLRNHAYHSYFEGYTEFYVTGTNGKTRIERVYTGKYYRQQLTPAIRVLLRLFYLCAFLGAAACFAVSSTAQIAGNMSPFVTVPQALCIPTLFWVGMSIASYLFSPALMKIYDYKSTAVSLRRSTQWAAFCEAAAAFMLTLYALFTGGLPAAARSILLLIGAGLLLAGMCLLEHRIPYETVVNANSERYSGTVIE